MTEFKKFLVPYDFSEHSRAALETALALALRTGASIDLVHVVQPPHYAYAYAAYGEVPIVPVGDLEELREHAMKSLREVATRIEGTPRPPGLHVVDGTSIADAIREVAEKLDSDLVVMGTHGRTGLAHVFLGSVTERTLRASPCPVLTVQADESEA